MNAPEAVSKIVAHYLPRAVAVSPYDPATLAAAPST